MFVPNNAKLSGHIFEGSLVILCQYHKGALFSYCLIVFVKVENYLYVIRHVVTYHECILVELVALLYCELILDV